MEALYAKLYKKYAKLKKERESEFDKLNHDQEVKFLNFVAAAEEMIQFLKSENTKLNGQVDELRGDLASARSSSDEQHIQYKKLWVNEKQKNKDLSEEITRLKILGRLQLEKSQDDIPSEETSGKSVLNLMKKRKSVFTTEGTTTPLVETELDRPVDQNIHGDKDSCHPSSIQQPLCCQKKFLSSGGDATETSSVQCIFQHLIEFVAGMKVSPLTQTNEPCVLAHHQSSGYSFSLTWIHNSRGEVELVYRVLSLGTFESVAPEWMKETIMFGPSMCFIFFERVKRVING